MLHSHQIFNMTDSLDQEQAEMRLKELAEKVLSQRRSYCTKCKSNNCIKHLERFRTVKLSLAPSKSTYGSNYQTRASNSVERVQIPVEQRRFSTIIGDSAYTSQFKQGPLSEYHLYGKKTDNIKIGGPLIAQSSYSQAYPETTGMSPLRQGLIKNPENLGVNANIKLKGCSSYRDNFKGGSYSRSVPIKRQGNLKLSGSFIGETSYKGQFVGGIPLQNESFKPKLIYRPVNGLKLGSSYNSEFPSYPSEAYSTVQ